MSTHTSSLPVSSLSRSRAVDFAGNAALAVVASIFVAVCAHIAIPVPFTPIPFTLQPFAVILVGMLLGPTLGFAALAAYLLEGAAGLPVFAPGATMGLARLLGPSAGYLFAYPVVAAIAGGLPRLLSLRNRFASFAISGTVAFAVLYTSATLWFSYLLHISVAASFTSTVAPFAASDAVKVAAAAGIASAIAARTRKA